MVVAAGDLVDGRAAAAVVGLHGHRGAGPRRRRDGTARTTVPSPRTVDGRSVGQGARHRARPGHSRPHRRARRPQGCRRRRSSAGRAGTTTTGTGAAPPAGAQQPSVKTWAPSASSQCQTPSIPSGSWIANQVHIGIRPWSRTPQEWSRWPNQPSMDPPTPPLLYVPVKWPRLDHVALIPQQRHPSRRAGGPAAVRRGRCALRRSARRRSRPPRRRPRGRAGRALRPPPTRGPRSGCGDRGPAGRW